MTAEHRYFHECLFSFEAFRPNGGFGFIAQTDGADIFQVAG